MSDAYLGEIRMFAGLHEPHGWRFCDGRLMAIKDHPELYEVIGNSFGGDGITDFALPDLRGRLTIGAGGPGHLHPLGDRGGQKTVQITPDHLPAHHHDVMAATATGDSSSPAGASLAATDPEGRERLYAQSARIAAIPLAPDTVGSSEGGPSGGDPVPVGNMMPGVTINYIIAVLGEPPRFM